MPGSHIPVYCSCTLPYAPKYHFIGNQQLKISYLSKVKVGLQYNRESGSTTSIAPVNQTKKNIWELISALLIHCKSTWRYTFPAPANVGSQANGHSTLAAHPLYLSLHSLYLSCSHPIYAVTNDRKHGSTNGNSAAQRFWQEDRALVRRKNGHYIK